MFYVDFTVDDDSTIIAEGETKETALANAEEPLRLIKAEGKHGFVSVYEGTGDIQKLYDGFKV